VVSERSPRVTVTSVPGGRVEVPVIVGRSSRERSIGAPVRVSSAG
jgi:hypothetical protein